MRSRLAAFGDRIKSIFSPPSAEGLDLELVKRMTRGIATARPDEISCDECFAQMDQFADLILVGRNAAEAMPHVQDHLNRCQDCREEFEALLDALRVVS